MTDAHTGHVYDDIFLEHDLGADHPESPERLRAINACLAQTGLIDRLTRVNQPVADVTRALLAVHDQTHIDSVDKCNPTGRVARRAVAHVLGALNAVHTGMIRNAFCAVRPPGHHAFNHGADFDRPGEGQGFCFYNTVAVAARYAQAALGYRRILICDWDYHYGNGTAWAFASDPSVVYFSTHNWQAYPGSGDPSYMGIGAGAGHTINVHLHSGATDRDFIDAWDAVLMARIAALGFEPDLVIISAGFDSRTGDTLGTFDITDEGFTQVTRRAMAIADRYCGGRLVSCLEGGYDVDGLGRAVCAHVATLAGFDWREFVPPAARLRPGGHALQGSPEIRQGLLYLPDDMVGRVKAIAVLDPLGRELFRTPRGELGKAVIDLWPMQPGDGAFVAVIQLTDAKTIRVPFGAHRR